MSQRKEDEKKRKKKQEAQIEAFLLSMLEKSMKSERTVSGLEMI